MSANAPEDAPRGNDDDDHYSPLPLYTLVQARTQASDTVTGGEARAEGEASSDTQDAYCNNGASGGAGPGPAAGVMGPSNSSGSSGISEHAVVAPPAGLAAAATAEAEDTPHVGSLGPGPGPGPSGGSGGAGGDWRMFVGRSAPRAGESTVTSASSHAVDSPKATVTARPASATTGACPLTASGSGGVWTAQVPPTGTGESECSGGAAWAPAREHNGPCGGGCGPDDKSSLPLAAAAGHVGATAAGPAMAAGPARLGGSTASPSPPLAALEPPPPFQHHNLTTTASPPTTPPKSCVCLCLCACVWMGCVGLCVWGASTLLPTDTHTHTIITHPQ